MIPIRSDNGEQYLYMTQRESDKYDHPDTDEVTQRMLEERAATRERNQKFNKERYKWSPTNTDKVYDFINEGGTQIKELAKFFGTSRETIYNWCRQHQEFREAVTHMKTEKIHNWMDRVETYGEKK